LNLCEGRWALELGALLERTRARRSRHGEIEAGSACRISLHCGEFRQNQFQGGAGEETIRAAECDFAVWQESENQWGVRLKAEPLRTDMSLSDTGLLRVNGRGNEPEACAKRRCSSLWHGTARSWATEQTCNRQ